MARLSVIIPIYNVEPYIERCLDSVAGQTWTDMEILCIDDGSTDKSGELCEQYAQKDRRIKVYHKENGGAASARNVGLKHAGGEYIAFVDPDDWIEPEMFESVISRMETCDADMGVCGFFKDWEDREEVMQNTPAVCGDVFGTDDILFYAFKRYSYKGFGGYLWNKVIKRELLYRTGETLKFDEALKVGEDVLFFAMTALRVQRAAYVDRALYHYYQRTSSLVHAGSIEERSGSLVMYARLINLFQERGIDSRVLPYVKRFYVYIASLLAEKAYYENDIFSVKKMQSEIGKYIEAYEATSENHPEWNVRMRLLMRDPEQAITYSRNRQDRKRRQTYAGYLTEPIENNWILYESFFGKGMICSPYAIFKSFMERQDFSQYLHIWSVSVESELERLQKKFEKIDNVKFVLRKSLEYTKYLAKCKYLINNDNFFYFFIKRNEQVYINTWHGIPMKKLGYDVPDGILAQHNSFRNFLMTDYILAWNRHMGEVFMSAYMLNDIYQGKIVLEGCPRNDNTLNSDPNEIKNKLQEAGVTVSPNKKLVLYAPTFRGTNLQVAKSDYEQVKEFLKQLSHLLPDGEYQILYKPHHLIYDQIQKEGIKDENVIPSYFDANEIMSITDILISDYSSIYFDFLITDRPIIFFVPDEEEYQEYRGLYFNTEKLPGAVCRTVDQVAEGIKRAETHLADYGEVHRRFKEWACCYDDGKVSERILDCMLSDSKAVRCMNETLTGKASTKVLILCGSLYREDKFRKLLDMIGEYDLDTCEVTVLFDEPKTDKVKERILTLDRRIRGLSRVTAMVMKEQEERLYEAYMDGDMEYSPDIEAIFARECKRCVPGMKFDEVRMVEEDPFVKGMLLAMKK